MTQDAAATGCGDGWIDRESMPPGIVERVAGELAGSGVSAPAERDYHVKASEDRGQNQLVIDFDLAPGVVLPIGMGGWALYPENSGRVASMAAMRMREISRRRPRLIDMLAVARGKVVAAVDRAGGDVRFVDLKFAPLDGQQGVNLRDVPLELVYDRLDNDLKVGREAMQAASAHRIAYHVRADAPRQRRLARQRARLASAGALFEVEPLAEAAIAAAGLEPAEVYARAAAGECPIHLSGEWSAARDTRMNVAMEEGWLRAYGYLTPAPLKSFVSMGRLRIDEPIPAERRAVLVGQPATALFDHSVLRAAGRIAHVEDRDGHLTDVRFGPVPSRLVYGTDLAPVVRPERAP